MAFRALDYGYDNEMNTVARQGLLYQTDWSDKDRSQSKRAQIKPARIFTGEIVRPDYLTPTQTATKSNITMPLLVGLTLIVAGVVLGTFLALDGQNASSNFLWKILIPTLGFGVIFGIIKARK